MKNRFPSRKIISLSICLSALAFLAFPEAHARLGDDRAALEKRFGKGTSVETPITRDRGIWELFDSVLSFEKSGIKITAGLVGDRCEAIIYDSPFGWDGRNPRAFSWTEVRTLMTKNAGDGEVTFRPNHSSSKDFFELKPAGAFAKIEENPEKRGSYLRVAIFSGNLFEDLGGCIMGEIRPEFLRDHPPKQLGDF